MQHNCKILCLVTPKIVTQRFQWKTCRNILNLFFFIVKKGNQLWFMGSMVWENLVYFCLTQVIQKQAKSEKTFFIIWQKMCLALREKFPYSEFFWSTSYHIWAEYKEIFLNIKKYIRIQSKCGKIRTSTYPNKYSFHAV